MRKVLVSAFIAAGMLGTVSMPLTSSAAVDVYVNLAPPPPRYEAVPASRSGYVWAPGHWQWNGRRHVWAGGFWERSRGPGYVFHNPTWVQQGDGRWLYQARRWEQGRGRDSDRDGIPDRRDPTPYGGTRAPDRDRDGVPDYRDARPNDPTRR